MPKNNQLSRRNNMEKLSPAEFAIMRAMDIIGRLDADERLTEAMVFLDKARNKVADFIDDVKS